MTRKGSLPVPVAVLADSYKATHLFQYPDAQEMVAYGEFRRSFEKDPEDSRIVHYGMRYIIENYISVQWTEEDVERASAFLSTHNSGQTPFPFPKDLFLKFVRENNGYFPVTIETLPEGSVIYPHVPVFQIRATGEYARLCTFLETILTMVWYPCSVGTLSRKARHAISKAFDKSVDDEARFFLDSRLHDFGMRGCTSVEQSIIGGAAHLLNFKGSDTLSSAYYVQYELNEGRPIAESIPATEHSVMTSFHSEKAAIENMISQFGTGAYSIVMDSYDYVRALTQVLPSVKELKTSKGGFLVVRPDSGDPVESVMQALKAGEAIFGVDVNKKGFKVLRGMGVIQGDGINMAVVHKLLERIIAEGFSVQNVVFGMGGGLLQKVNRDTMSFATKLAFIRYADGTERNIMKAPKTDPTKFSLPGRLAVRYENGVPIVHPKGDVPDTENALRVVYDKGPVAGWKWDTFDVVRARLEKQWNSMPAQQDVIAPALKALIAETRKEQQDKSDVSLAGLPIIPLEGK